MSLPATDPPAVRFGPFLLDLRTGELIKDGGHRILLPDQLFRLLAILTRQPGVLVTRDQLRRELWADDTFVDFDYGLNAAIRRLREALDDSAGAPRFVETLPRRGYRFVAAVETVGERAPANATEAAPGVPHPRAESSSPDRPRGRLIAFALGAAAFVALAVVAAQSSGLWTRSEPVIAVLPLKSLGPGGDHELFVDGFTDELIQDLAGVEGLRVRSRTSSFVFKQRQPSSLRDVGDRLAANLVLEGSVLRDGSRVRVNARLVQVSDDVTLWSGRFDRPMADIMGVQHDIARSIVNALRLQIGPSRRRYETSVDAYELFLRARALQSRRAGDSARAAALFREVVQKDTAFAPAYAGLASTYSEMSFLYPGPQYAIADADALLTVAPAAERAMALDPLLADAHAAMGHLFALQKDWPRSEAAFRRALELSPRHTTLYTDFVLMTLLPQGRLDAALNVLDAALRADPTALDALRVLAHVQLNARQYPQAIANAERVLAIDPSYPFVTTWRARALLFTGDSRDAIRLLEEQPDAGEGYLGYAYAVTGRRVEAETLAAKFPNHPQRQLLIYAGLGDADRAFAALDALAAVNARRAGAYLSRPELASLRNDARMAAVRRRLGLPPA